jgi:hypothetical protein
MERSEKYGLGVAAVGHVLLFGLLSVGFLATPNPLKLESKPIDISLVDDVSLESAAPATIEPPASASAPEVGPPEEAPPPAETMPEPNPAPPVPEAAPAPPPKPAPVAKPQPVKPAPAKSAPAKPAPAKPAPAVKAPPAATKAAGTNPAATKPKPRGSLLGDDFRKSLAATQTPGTAQAPRSANVGAKAVASLGDAIARQVQPCANRIPNPGPGANQIRTKLRLQMDRDGTLAARPSVSGQTGVDGDNQRYAQRVAELATSAIIQCAPYKLPAELYEGGWKDIIINYRLPG